MIKTSTDILLVEDDRVMAHALHRFIKHEGMSEFSVRHAITLEDALQQLNDTSISAVVLDLNLPDSHGVETFDAITRANPDLPVLILSGMDDQELAVETVKKGAQDYLVKGLDSGDSLIRAIRYSIERKRSELENKRLQEVIQEDRRLEALGVLASGVAHEINTPLQFVRSNVQFLKLSFDHIQNLMNLCARLCNEDLTPEESKGVIEAMRKEMDESKFDYIREQLAGAISETENGIGRVVQIVRAMNVFSHKAHKELVHYDINRAVRDAVLISRGEWKAAANLTTDLGSSLPMVPCYPEELSQAILNLIVNASHSIAKKLKHTDGDDGKATKGMIAITTGMSDSNDAVEITVSDSGSGIPEAIRHRVFEPFFTTKVVGEGSGQGLAYVYNTIVKRHGGSISFESNIDQGTTFRLSLPVEVSETIAEHTLKSTPYPAGAAIHTRGGTS